MRWDILSNWILRSLLDLSASEFLLGRGKMASPNASTPNVSHGADSTATLTRQEKPTGELELATDEHEQLVTDEFPHGVRLILIVGAIMFSIFLMALDQVSTPELPLVRRKRKIRKQLPTDHLADDCRHSDSQNHRRVPRPR